MADTKNMLKTMSDSQQVTARLLFILMLSLAMVAGIALGAGAYILVAPLALLLPAIYLLLRPDICLVFFAGLTLLVSGSLRYFLGLGQFQWALSALGIALLCSSVARASFSRNVSRAPADGMVQAMLLWWAGLIFASAANGLPVLDWLVGIRIYLPVFGIFAYLAYCRPKEQLLQRILLFMVAIASVQWIFSIYQKLVVVPVRIAAHYPGSSFDSIVGSFGGEKFGGGEAGSLGIYLSIMMAVGAALYKYGQLKTHTLIWVFLSGFAGMALIESKVIVVMVPIGCFLVYRDYALRQPGKFLAGAAAIGVLMLGLLVVYYYLHWQADSRGGFSATLAHRFSYIFDPDFKASATNQGRLTTLLFWWKQHSLLDEPLTFLFGHGLASAVYSSSLIGYGSAVLRYGYQLDTTGISKLLWETGAIGATAFLLIFIFGFFRARFLADHPAIPPWHRAAMRGVEAAMVLMALSTFYEVTVVSSPPMQFVAMFMLGYVAYWWRETAPRCRA